MRDIISGYYMTNVSKYKNVACIAFALSFAFPSIAAAHEHEEDMRRMEVKQKMHDQKQRATSTDQVCSALAIRIGKRLEDFDMNHVRHAGAYVQHKEKLLQIADKLDAKGISSSRLRGNIAILDAKISEFVADKEKVRGALVAAQDLSCGNSDGEFRAAIASLRAAQQAVVEDAEDIRSFIQGTIRQDIIDLRKKI